MAWAWQDDERSGGARGPRYPNPAVVYPHSGICARCLRDRDDLFYHQQDEAFYCADIARCEARYYIQGDQ